MNPFIFYPCLHNFPVVFVTYGSKVAVEEDKLVVIPVSLKASSTGPSLCTSQNLMTQREVQMLYTFFDGNAKSV